MDFAIKLQGFEGLAKGLADLPDNINRNALSAAVRAGAAVVRDEARLEAPVRSGKLKRSIWVKRIRELSGNGRETFFIGARSAKNWRVEGSGFGKVKAGSSVDAYYGKWVELGHFSRPAGRGQLPRGKGRASAIQGMLKAGTVHWIAGRPFLVPAFRMKTSAATEAMAAKLRERLERFRVQGK